MPISQKVKNRQESSSYNVFTREPVRVNTLYINKNVWYGGVAQRSCNSIVQIPTFLTALYLYDHNNYLINICL